MWILRCESEPWYYRGHQSDGTVIWTGIKEDAGTFSTKRAADARVAAMIAFYAPADIGLISEEMVRLPPSPPAGPGEG